MPKSSKRKIAKRKKLQKIKSTPAADLVIKTKPEWVKNSLTNKTQYQKKYTDSIKSNDNFWRREGKRITWIKPYKKIKDIKYSKDDVHIKWFYDGTLNASANCIDRHLKKNANKTAIIWVGDDPKVQKKLHIRNFIKRFQKRQMD